MNLKRHAKDSPDINLTPLIDVVFLLLIFFMVSTTFKKEASIDIDLPEASSVPTPQKVGTSLEIIITSDSTIYIDKHYKGKDGKDKIEKNRMVRKQVKYIKRALRKISRGNNKLRVFIRADSKSPHQTFIRVMDALARLGFKRISILTVPPKKR